MLVPMFLVHFALIRGFPATSITARVVERMNFATDGTRGNPFWKLIRNVLKTPGKGHVNCQPKPILLDTGEIKMSYDWVPEILPIQILRIEQSLILNVPSEFTTMAGRRLRDAVKMVLTNASDGAFNGLRVVIAGLTNTYSQYVTTCEEYAIQSYEGAQEFQRLAKALTIKTVDPGPSPPDLLNKQIGFLTPVVMDMAPLRSKLGDTSTDVPKNATYKRNDMVSVVGEKTCLANIKRV